MSKKQETISVDGDTGVIEILEAPEPKPSDAAKAAA